MGNPGGSWSRLDQVPIEMEVSAVQSYCVESYGSGASHSLLSHQKGLLEVMSIILTK